MATHSSSGVLHLTYIQSFSRLVPCPHVSILFSDAIHLINIGFHFLCCFSLTFAQLLRILAWSIQSSLIDFSQTSSATLNLFFSVILSCVLLTVLNFQNIVSSFTRLFLSGLLLCAIFTIFLAIAYILWILHDIFLNLEESSMQFRFCVSLPYF